MIAVGSGSGQLISVSLELVDECMPTKSSNMALALQVADVTVSLKEKKANSNGIFTPNMWDSEHENIGNILSNIALRDDAKQKHRQARVGKTAMKIIKK